MKLKEYKSLNKQDNDTKLKEGMRLNELIAGWAGYNLSRDIDYEIKNVVQPYINENGNINPNVYIYILLFSSSSFSSSYYLSIKIGF